MESSRWIATRATIGSLAIVGLTACAQNDLYCEQQAVSIGPDVTSSEGRTARDLLAAASGAWAYEAEPMVDAWGGEYGFASGDAVSLVLGEALLGSWVVVSERHRTGGYYCQGRREVLVAEASATVESPIHGLTLAGSVYLSMTNLDALVVTTSPLGFAASDLPQEVGLTGSFPAWAVELAADVVEPTCDGLAGPESRLMGSLHGGLAEGIEFAIGARAVTDDGWCGAMTLGRAPLTRAEADAPGQ